VAALSIANRYIVTSTAFYKSLNRSRDAGSLLFNRYLF
jgi:hypothetical protein